MLGNNECVCVFAVNKSYISRTEIPNTSSFTHKVTSMHGLYCKRLAKSNEISEVETAMGDDATRVGTCHFEYEPAVAGRKRSDDCGGVRRR